MAGKDGINLDIFLQSHWVLLIMEIYRQPETSRNFIA